MGPNQPGQPAGLEGSISRLGYLHSRDAPWVTLEELLCALARLEDSSLGQGIQASTPELLGAERIKADSVMEGCHGSHSVIPQCESTEDSLETPQIPQTVFREPTNAHCVSSVTSAKMGLRHVPP